MTDLSGYWVQPGDETLGYQQGVDEIARRGYRPFTVGDPIDETMPAESLRLVAQVGMEHLARLGGAANGDPITTDLLNRGLLVFLRDRDRYSTGQHA
jgi:hypothetical protein